MRGNDANVVNESQCGNLNRKEIGWKEPSVGSAERDRLMRVAVASQTVGFIKKKFEC